MLRSKTLILPNQEFRYIYSDGLVRKGESIVEDDLKIIWTYEYEY